MPAGSSNIPAASRVESQEGIELRNVNENHNSRRSNSRRGEHNVTQGHEITNGHMTLDGRRRGRNGHRQQPATENQSEQWNDWTSTWRKIGNKGQSREVTMTGTVTRGKKKGQVVDVQLDLTDRELMEISTIQDRQNPSTPDTPDSLPSSGFEPKTSGCGCSLREGPHILLVSIIAFPFIFIGSLFVSFYFGALTWQNIFSYYYDERTIWHRISICPLLVLSFPLFIVVFTFGIATYAAFVQIRWSFVNWKNEAGSLEKGFYGWLCGKLGLESCSPYTVIELFSSSDQEAQNQEGSSHSAEGSRVAVVYSERSNSQRSRQSRNDTANLPSTSGHNRMERVRGRT